MLKQLLNLPTMSTTSEEKHRQLAPRQAAAVQPLLPRSNRVAWGCSNSTDMSLFANWSVILVRCLIRNLVRGFDSSTADSKPPVSEKCLQYKIYTKKPVPSQTLDGQLERNNSCRPPCLVTNEEAKFRISSSLKKQENLKKSNHVTINRMW